MTPMFTKRPIPIGTYEGRGALWSFNGYSRWVPYCAPFNHTGQPAASVPAGFTDDGFPLAVQLVAPPRRRGDARLARRPDRGRAAVGGPRPAALIELAEEIARAAGAQLRAAFETELRIETKSSPTDLVSEADVAAEKLIRERLLAARPDDGMLGEEGSDTRGSERAALDRRPARRHHELPVRDPAVGRLDRGRGRAGHARRRRLRPDARRAVGRPRAASRRRSTAGRSTAASTRPSSPRRSSPPASATRPTCAPPRPRSAAACSRACATSAAWARPRSTSRGPPRAATTPTSSAASRRGTTPRAR